MHTDNADESLAALIKAFPYNSQEQLQRFAVARRQDPKAAVDMFAKHLQWREGQGHPENLAARHAQIPEFFISPVAHNGQVGCLIQGACYDPSAATPEQYALAVCH